MDVELLDPSGEADNAVRVGRGDADFCLSRAAGFLVAAAGSPEPLGARFVAVLVGRSPISAFVPAPSAVVGPAQLPGLRVGGAVWAMAEFLGAMSWLGLNPPVVVPMSRTSGGGLLQEACAMLAADDVDMVADFEDLLPRVRRHAGMDVRSVPLGAEVYSSGLVAADRIPDDLVDRVRTAVLAAMARQRGDPALGLAQLVARSPRVVPADAVEGWQLVEPRIFTGDRAGSMTGTGWATTVEYLSAAHGLDPVALDLVWRAVPAQPPSVSSGGGPARPGAPAAAAARTASASTISYA